jgi:ribose/xylose/arabinose/galactoside ABC-type transport system permease subunit
VLLRATKLGRHALAVGSNEEAARLCGIDVERTKLAVYGLGVGCAGIASVLQLSYLSMGDPTTAQGAELKVIAAAVIGGASLSGGEGSILGTLLAPLLMTVIDNGCTKLGLDNWVQECVTGAIIVAAVAVDRLRHRATLENGATSLPRDPASGPSSATDRRRIPAAPVTGAAVRWLAASVGRCVRSG